MPRPTPAARDGINADTKWVLAGICAVGLLLMGGLTYWIKDTANEGHRINVELIKSIGEVERAVAVTNTKLDSTNSKLDVTNTKLDTVISKLPPAFR